MPISPSPSYPKPVVSVCLIAYNHAPFIAQAIDSVLAQKLTLPWELIIADDCSTDGTSDIALGYARQFPERIRYWRHPQNLGSVRNWLHALQAARGDFIAHLDGDDFWTDPDKLHKQFSILQQHPQCSLCHTNGLVLDAAAPAEPIIKIDFTTIHSFGDVLQGGRVPHLSTCMWRREAMPQQWPAWIYNTYNGDVALFAILSLKGSFYFLNESTTRYRRHNNSWLQTVASDVHKCYNALQLFSCIDELLQYRYRRLLNRHRADHLEFIAFSRLKNREWLTFLHNLGRSLWYQPLRSTADLRRAYYRFKDALNTFVQPAK